MPIDVLLMACTAGLIASAAMTGVIWFVQLVHYPLMACVGVHGFTEYEAQHTRRTTLVVAPLMLLEAMASVVLALAALGLASFDGLTATTTTALRPFAFLSIGIVLGLWASTFLVQVPLHARLSGGFHAGAHRALVRSNWLRTVGWTAHVVVLTAAIATIVRSHPDQALAVLEGRS